MNKDDIRTKKDEYGFDNNVTITITCDFSAMLGALGKGETADRSSLSACACVAPQAVFV